MQWRLSRRLGIRTSISRGRLLCVLLRSRLDRRTWWRFRWCSSRFRGGGAVRRMCTTWTLLVRNLGLRRIQWLRGGIGLRLCRRRTCMLEWWSGLFPRLWCIRRGIFRWGGVALGSRWGFGILSNHCEILRSVKSQIRRAQLKVVRLGFRDYEFWVFHIFPKKPEFRFVDPGWFSRE